MTPPPKCCNPFSKEGHNHVKTNLFLLTKKWDKKFSALYGLYVCARCKKQLYENKDSVNFENFERPVNQALEKIEEDEHEPSNDEEDEVEIEKEIKSVKTDQDYVCKAVDNKNKRLRLAAAVQEALMAPAKKKEIKLIKVR